MQARALHVYRRKGELLYFLLFDREMTLKIRQDSTGKSGGVRKVRVPVACKLIPTFKLTVTRRK
eukprot:981968-Pyramimonas_sp.AAC.1